MAGVALEPALFVRDGHGRTTVRATQDNASERLDVIAATPPGEILPRWLADTLGAVLERSEP